MLMGWSVRLTRASDCAKFTTPGRRRFNPHRELPVKAPRKLGTSLSRTGVLSCLISTTTVEYSYRIADRGELKTNPFSQMHLLREMRWRQAKSRSSNVLPRSHPQLRIHNYIWVALVRQVNDCLSYSIQKTEDQDRIRGIEARVTPPKK